MLGSNQTPWVSFCMSTYKRPDFLRQQLSSLLKQTFPSFEIVISDNDPEGSGANICDSFNDHRIRYFHNVENIGMIKSFNKSIERSRTDFIVMVTDDDPIDLDFLSVAYSLWKKNPDYGVYGGFRRKNKSTSEFEIIPKESFIVEILNWKKTPQILWSSCVLNKEVVMAIGKIPEYGSPHLADHALIALVGDRAGGIILNKMYSSYTSHDTNFSKLNFQTYLVGCRGFYSTMQLKMQKEKISSKYRVVEKHLSGWLLAIIYTLKRYYAVNSPDKVKLEEVEKLSKEIIQLPFMRKNRSFLVIKDFIFKLKLYLGILKPTH